MDFKVDAKLLEGDSRVIKFGAKQTSRRRAKHG